MRDITFWIYTDKKSEHNFKENYSDENAQMRMLADFHILHCWDAWTGGTNGIWASW